MTSRPSSPPPTATSACPVNSSALWPAIWSQRPRAASTSRGLPTSSPSRNSIESAPMTMHSRSVAAIRAATLRAFASASAVTVSTGSASAPSSARSASSSTSDTSTRGSTPAPRRIARRAGDAEARTRRTSRNPTSRPWCRLRCGPRWSAGPSTASSGGAGGRPTPARSPGPCAGGPRRRPALITTAGRLRDGGSAQNGGSSGRRPVWGGGRPGGGPAGGGRPVRASSG